MLVKLSLLLPRNSPYSYHIGKSSVIEIIFNTGIIQLLQKIDDLTRFH